jgi:hypothetical protein
VTYFPITTSTNGLPNFDHQVIHFFVSLPLEFARLQECDTIQKVTINLHNGKNEREGKRVFTFPFTISRRPSIGFVGYFSTAVLYNPQKQSELN